MKRTVSRCWCGARRAAWSRACRVHPNPMLSDDRYRKMYRHYFKKFSRKIITASAVMKALGFEGVDNMVSVTYTPISVRPARIEYICE